MEENKERLEKVFSNVNYYVEKMYGYGSYSEPLRKVGLEMVEGELKDFCNILKDMKIDIDKHFGIKDVYKQLEYPMLELKKYFNKDINSHINNRDAEIFVWYIGNRLSELKDMAVEIEKEYLEKRDINDIIDPMTKQTMGILKKMAMLKYGGEKEQFEEELKIRIDKGEDITNEWVDETIDKIKKENKKKI